MSGRQNGRAATPQVTPESRAVGRRFKTWMLVPTLVALMIGMFALITIGPWLEPRGERGTGPSDFAGISITRTPPGSAGCRAVSGDLCYVVEVASAFPDLPFADLFFAVSNASSFAFPEQNSVPLGPGAGVSVLSSASVIGAWNLSSNMWSGVPPGFLPTSTAVPLVLDTGLTSNATFASSWFLVEHHDPYGGSVGFSLAH